MHTIGHIMYPPTSCGCVCVLVFSLFEDSMTFTCVSLPFHPCVYLGCTLFHFCAGLTSLRVYALFFVSCCTGNYPVWSFDFLDFCLLYACFFLPFFLGFNTFVCLLLHLVTDSFVLLQGCNLNYTLGDVIVSDCLHHINNTKKK